MENLLNEITTGSPEIDKILVDAAIKEMTETCGATKEDLIEAITLGSETALSNFTKLMITGVKAVDLMKKGQI